MEKSTKFQPLMEKAIELNKEMVAQLTEFVKEHGNFIRTDLYGEREVLPSIDCYAKASDFEAYKEYPLMGIAVDDAGDLIILPDFTEGYQNLGEMSTEEILNLDDWLNFYDGYVLVNATLYNICDMIAQYV